VDAPCQPRSAPVISVKVAPGRADAYVSRTDAWHQQTLSLRSTAISLEVRTGGGGWRVG